MRSVTKSVFGSIPTLAILIILHGCGSSDGGSGTDSTETGAAASQPGAKAKSVSPTTVRLTQNLQSVSKCNIETVNGSLFEPTKSSWSARDTSHVAGWIIDENGKSVPSEAKIIIQAVNGKSAWEQKLNGGIARPDVVKAFGNQAGFLKSGFTVDLDLGGVNFGAYDVYLSFPSNNGELICGGWRFVLTK